MTNANKDILRTGLLFTWYFILPIVLGGLYFSVPILNAFLTCGFMFFVCLTAVFTSVMDSVENEHINNTIFAKLRPEFWSKRVSWNKAKTILKYKLDAWHIAKSLALISGGLALIFSFPVRDPWMDLLMIAYFYNITFNLFYTHLFKKR